MAKAMEAGTAAVLDASPEDRFPALQALPGVAEIGETAAALVHDEYFDTEDLRLARRGIALCRRTGGADEGWHLDTAGDGGGSLREPLGTGEDPPAVLAEAAQAHLRGRAVHPVARVTITRRTSPLLDGAGRVVAEVSDDHLSGETLGTEGPPESWREWRIEVALDSDRLGEALADAFAQARPERGLGHLERTLGPAMPEPKGGRRRPRNRTVSAFLDYAQDQADALLDLDPLVREDAPDSVHQMRVASRRLRSALSTYRKAVGKERGKALRDELKWLGQVLGRARDAEVMRERLAEMVREEPADLVLGPVYQAIAEDLGAEHHAATADVAEALRSQRYFALLDGLEALLADLADDAGPKGKRPTLRRLTKRDAKRLREAIRTAAEARGTDDADVHLHEARKAAKRLRYAAESAAAFGAGKAAKLEKRAHRIQQVLGEHQDSIVTAELLRRLATEAHARGENAFTYGRLHARETQLSQDTEAEFYRLRKKLPAALGG